MEYGLRCPSCGTLVETWRNPAPTVDIVIYDPVQGVVLIERNNPPFGYALPGGFVDVGESVEQAAVREAKEETGLTVRLTGLLGVYSDPRRDPRKHTLSMVFMATAANLDQLNAGDDAATAALFQLDTLPSLVFDHAQMLAHVREVLAGKRPLIPVEEVCGVSAG